MDKALRRAVTAGLSGERARALKDMLAERGYVPSGSAADAADGLRLVEALQPALVAAAAVMPGMDGVAFAERLRGMRLGTQPAVLLLRPRGLRLPGEAGLHALGAEALDLPINPAALDAALATLEDMPPALPPARAEKLSALLDALGVPGHPGRKCLALAAALVWQDRSRLSDMKGSLYPPLCRQTGLTQPQAERAMRYAIDAAWRTGQIDNQHRIFGDTIDARRGKPTCGEMIAQLAEELRWEE